MKLWLIAEHAREKKNVLLPVYSCFKGQSMKKRKRKNFTSVVNQDPETQQ